MTATAYDPTLDAILDGIIAAEGRTYTNHPADRGGPTKYGITLATLSAYWGEVATAQDVADLDEATARAIYRQNYITRPRFHDIPYPRVRALVVDCGVLHGPPRAARWLQAAVGADQDGVVGLKTLAAVEAAGPERAFEGLLAARLRFLGRLITDDRSQAVFAAGWLARVARFLKGDKE